MSCFLLYLQWNALYVENMLRVESSAIGEIIGSRILMAVVDRLIEIDVSGHLFVIDMPNGLWSFFLPLILVF